MSDGEVKYTTKEILGKGDDAFVYTSVDVSNRGSLPAGLYKIATTVYNGGMMPGFFPRSLSNDKPLGIDGKVDAIVKEIDVFLGKRDLYKRYGFSHKRGYLLFGPPGCGKSSTLRLLEERFIEKFDGLVLFWTPGESPVAYYEAIRKREPTRRIMLVVEDLDNQVHYFEETILEFLDGQVGLDNFVLVATTNNLEAIPSRIKDRPSRIDKLLEIGLPSEETRFLYLKSIGIEAAEAKKLSKKTKGLSIAQIKEVVIATVILGEDLKPAMARLRKADMTPTEPDEDE